MTEYRLREVLWNAGRLASLVPVNVVRMGDRMKFEVWEIMKGDGSTFLQYTCHHPDGNQYDFYMVPTSGVPSILEDKGVDFDSTGWEIREEDLDSAMEALKLLMKWRKKK